MKKAEVKIKVERVLAKYNKKKKNKKIKTLQRIRMH